ncbi:MAG: hypothetical protein AAGA62_01045 [Bacteroidota bacterium]
MATDLDNNAVALRLRRLQELFRQAYPVDAPPGLCLWLVEPDEVDMIGAFVLTEDSPGAVFRDLFLTFVGADAGASHYLKQLGEEWQAQLTAAADTLMEQGFSPSLWEQPPTVRSLADFFRYVQSVTGHMKHMKGRTVIYFRPESYADETAFVSLFEAELRRGLPGNLLLMLHATENSAANQRLAGRKDWGVTTLRPALNMASVAAELAAEGNPNDPAVQYRVLFLEMSEQGAKGAFGKMKEAGEKVYALAQQQVGWEHLLVSILAAQGAHLLTNKRHRKEALDFFRRARKDAELALKVGNPAGRAVLLQALNFEGAGLFHLKDYSTAAATYTEAATFASEDENDAFHAMEGFRMAGWCHERAGDRTAAWDSYHKSLAAAEKLSSEVLRGSTLPYLGRELLRLVEDLNRHAEGPGIRTTLERLVGPDWKELIAKAQKPQAA